MSPSRGKQPRRIFGYEVVYLSHKTNFDVDEYVQNPSLIKKLHEEKELAHAYSRNLEKSLEDRMSLSAELELQMKEFSLRLEEAKHVIERLEEDKRVLDSFLKEKTNQLESLRVEKHDIEIELTRTVGKLEEVSRNSFVQFLISALATVLLGFGVNIVTTTPSNWIGWVLIAVSIVLGIIAFVLVRKR